jgi:anti-sigma regulatory factor (Ser/Thr protein kinase)
MFVRPGQSLSIQIQDPSQIGEARRSVIHSATRLGLDEEAAGKLGLVATELGTNLIKHAGGGEILLQTLEDSFEIMAVDKGPGISDWRRAFEDGFSTSGTPGTGLGAVARISSDYFAYGVAGRGSIVISRVAQRKVAESHFDLGAICVPIRGETECGDSWVVLHTRRPSRRSRWFRPWARRRRGLRSGHSNRQGVFASHAYRPSHQDARGAACNPRGGRSCRRS